MRQAILQDAPDLLAPPRLRVEAPARVAFVVIGVWHDIGDEAFVLALLTLRDHDAGLYGETFLDGGLDGAELDAVTPDLDHKVHATQDLQTPVGEDAGPVTRAVHSGTARRRERVFRKSLLSLLGKLDVTAGEAVAADEELSRLTLGDLLAFFI